jgi:hypothetical protein
MADRNVRLPDASTDKTSEIDPAQAWFWTDEWQAGEREADEDLQAGRYEDYDNIDDFIGSL